MKMTQYLEHRDVTMDPFFSHSSNLHLPPSPPITSHLFIDEVDNTDYRFESARLESYKNWPSTCMKPERLAAAGFYYIGEGDKVRCFECYVEICQWMANDDPMVDHQRWSGRCRFIRKIPCGNVPIGADPSTIPEPMPKGHDVCGPYGVEYKPNSSPDNNMQSTCEPSTAKPKHPEFANYEARLCSFALWPRSMPQTKEQLATAGFYYTGKGDQTLCYHCGGGLKDWEPEDNPWEQHAKWFSKCYYLLTVQGQEYVDKVTGRSHNEQGTLEQSLIQGLKEKVDTECNPGPSSQNSIGSQDSGIESIGSSGMELNETIMEELITNKQHSGKPIDDARMCKICYNRELRKVFVPCGHLVACAECAKNMHVCAVCRKPVIDTVQAFIS